MEPTRDELRLVEIQFKLSDLGCKDDFNLAVRRHALTTLELLLSDRVARKRASVRA